LTERGKKMPLDSSEAGTKRKTPKKGKKTKPFKNTVGEKKIIKQKK